MLKSSWIFILIPHCDNSSQVNISVYSDTLFWLRVNHAVFVCASYFCMFSGGAANTNVIVFGLIRPEIELMVYRILGRNMITTIYMHTMYMCLRVLSVLSNWETLNYFPCGMDLDSKIWSWILMSIVFFISNWLG